MIHVRERPPLRHTIEAITPTGRRYRWAQDSSDPANVFGGLQHSSTMPGGFESCSCELPRKPGVDYADLERFTTLIVRDAGMENVGEYRLERGPKTSGDRVAVNPSAVGWQALLDDDKSAGELYVGRDLGPWGEPSATRKAGLLASGYAVERSLTAEPDQAGSPGLSMLIKGPFGDSHAEAVYDAGAGNKIARLYVGSVARIGLAADSSLFATPRSWSDDQAGGEQAGSDYESASSIAFGPATPQRFMVLNWFWDGAGTAGTDNDDYGFRYRDVAVYGDHGLTRRGPEPAGLWASDVVAHAVSGCPLLNFTEGPDGTIRPSSFVIDHLAPVEMTTRGEIVRQATRFGLQDWAVWEKRTFWWHERGVFGRKWRARIGPSQFEEIGPSVDRLWESIVVQYQDVDGSTRTAGPPGSGADTESADLQDADPENPATKLGIVRRDLLLMGVGTAAAATEVGRRFLEQTKLLDNSGQARIVGHIEDDRGVLHPYSHARGGDTISFVDAADPSERRIVKADHNHPTRTCTIDLDAPPEGLAAVLERLQVVLVPLGVA